MERNGGVHRHFLTGKEEVDAFKASEFIKMHNSTLCKVGFFGSVMRKLINGTLQTLLSGWGVVLDRVFESRTAKGIGLFATLLSIAFAFKEVIAAIKW